MKTSASSSLGNAVLLSIGVCWVSVAGCSDTGAGSALRQRCLSDYDCRDYQVCVFPPAEAGSTALPPAEVDAGGLAGTTGGTSDAAGGTSGSAGGASSTAGDASDATAGVTDATGGAPSVLDDESGAQGSAGEGGSAGVENAGGTPGTMGAAGTSPGSPDAEGEKDSGIPEAPDASPHLPTPGQSIDETIGMCRCRDELCPPGEACSAERNTCEPAPCSATVLCGGSKAQYCDLTVHTCSLLNDQCGTVETAVYGCPTLAGWLSAGVSIDCVHPKADVPGMCRFQFDVPLIPAPPSASAGLTMEEPQDGQAFGEDDDIEFRVVGSNLTTFLFVTESLPTDAAQAASRAIWGAIFAKTSSSDVTRTIRYSQGKALLHGVYQETAGTPPRGRTLYALAYAVDGDRIISIGQQAVRFSVGRAGASAGDDCVASADSTGTVTPAARAAACSNPYRVLACLADHCRDLCLAETDCTVGHCVLHPELGVKACE